MADRVGQQLGNYRLLRLVGRGGQASVYLGEHTYLHKPAALKLLHLYLDEHDADQFLREAQTLARLDHPHIVRVLDFAVQDGLPYLVMDYAVGGTLRTKHPAGTRLPLEQILPYVTQVASALQYAHDQRLIHRDIKPENMLLDVRSQVLLADFGLALLTATRSASTKAMDPAMVGTAPYLAPEQVQGQPCVASDQYALAIVVYEWLSGQHPFKGTPIEVALQHVSAALPPLHEQRPDLSPEVEQVVMRALAKAPEHRFPSVQDFATALQHAAHPAGNVYLTSAVPTTSAATPGERTEIEPFWKVPTSLTSLVGREQDVVSVCELLSRPEVRLLTITGTGGIGKTRLSIQVASQLRDHFTDGICFVDLAPLSDPSLVLSSIAYELGLQKGGAQPLVETVKDWLRDKHFLLLLDNFEHLLVAAPHLTTLLSSCPSLKILVTSRATLHAQGEQEFAVPPLTLPDLKELPPPDVLSEYAAVALFLRRSRAVKPNFQLTVDNARAVAKICVWLEGLPLAIELAAARIRLLPPQTLLARLSHRLDVLTSGARDLPERQQTLRNTLKWSYNLLEEEEQRLFRRLAVFVGGCTLEAVEAVCAQMKESGMSVLDRVASLLNNSLLLLIEQEGEEPRLQMLMTVREYALECLAAGGEMEATHQAYAVYYLALVKEAEPQLRGAQQLVWLRRLEQEHDNLRAVMQWWLGQAEAREDEQSREMALQLGGALEWFWIMRGYYSEGWDFLERALAAGEGGVVSIRAKALIAAARMADSLGDQNWAELLCKEGLALYRELGDTQGIAFSLHRLGMVAGDKGNVAVARSLLEEALALRRELGDTHGIAWSLWQLGRVIGEQGEYTRARALFEESLALFREVGDTHGIAWSLLWLAKVRFDSQGDQAEEQSLLEESLMHLKEVGDRDGIAHYFILSVRLALSQGHVPAARSLAEKSLALSREMGSRERIGESLSFLGKVAVLEGNQTAACTLYKESLVLLREEGYKRPIACGLEGLASVVAVQGEPAWAARLWGAAEALRESIGAPLPPVERAHYEQEVTAARAQLGEKHFTDAWSQGMNMTVEQVLAAQELRIMPEQVPDESPLVAKTPSSTYPAGLTPREVEVLRLVAQGLTNAQVAEQLVISPRTINWYLTSIYSKLGVSSRSAATRYAIEQHLL